MFHIFRFDLCPVPLRRLFAPCLLVASSLAVLDAQPGAPVPPSFVLIVADDLGYGDLGVQGQRNILTPSLDALAAAGLRFTQFYSGSTVCAPSRSVLMTGQHVGRTIIRGNRKNARLRPRDVTIAEVLKEVGYATATFGKWGLGNLGSTGMPTRQGFDEFYGYLNQVHAHDYYPDYLIRNEARETLPGNQGSARTQYTHDLFTAAALDFIDRHRTRPFFLYLPYTIPHTNNERGNQGMEVPASEPSLTHYNAQGWPQQEANKAAMITRMDRDVGRIVSRLRQHGIDNRTLVIFTSDNGPHSESGIRVDFHDSNGPLRGKKRDLYEGGIRVPAIFHWSGSIGAGRVTEQPGAFHDILPTLAELAGASAHVPADVNGVSLAPTLLGQPRGAQPVLYWEFDENAQRQAVRQGKWKALRRTDGTVELYDLEADLGETNDLAARRPGEVAGLVALMDRENERTLTGPPGLVGHWPLEEGTGRSVADRTGTSPGSLVNMTPASNWSADTPGAAEGALLESRYSLLFDGVNDHIATHYPGVGGRQPRTVTFWVKTRDTGLHAMVAWGLDSTRGQKWHVRLNSGAPGVIGALRTEVQSGSIVGTRNIADGRWHHVASVFAGTNVTDVELWVDGQREAVSAVMAQEVDTEIFRRSSRYLTIGAGWQGNSGRFFAGRLDDVGLFSVALSAEEIRLVGRHGVAAYPAGTGATVFRRGDPNADGVVDISDPVSVLLHLFLGSGILSCQKAGDTNDDGALDITDAIHELAFLFIGGPPPPHPLSSCGVDPTPDGLSCESHSPCR